MSRFSPPYLGAAYYPEAWPLSQVDEDIALMKDAGMTLMRIGEFAWSAMEPEEGRYELGWLRTVVDKLADAGIATVMGTPTCTPPAWLTEKYPEILPLLDDGSRMKHGERQHRCPNNPTYREYCRRIITKLAEEFGHDDKVIGWQIDNEIHPIRRRGCCCPVCREKFLARLEEHFGTIAALNEAWGTNLWSQTYNTFSQIPIPDADHRHHPSLMHAWWTFVSDSCSEFVTEQAKLLHELADQPVGTDMMPTQVMDWKKTHAELDVVQFNHYNFPENLPEVVIWMDLARSMLDVPWWNTETSTCWNGGLEIRGYREPGFCRANSWLPVALGGEMNLYWLWRSHWSGQELVHGSVVQSCGRPLHIIDEVRETSAGFAKAAEFLNGTRPANTGLALHMSGDAWHLYHAQPIVRDFDFKERLIHDYHLPLIRAQYRPDVIDPAEDMSPYRLVLSPYLPSLEEDGVGARALEWVKAGGTWVVGPLSDIRTLEATKYRHAPFGFLEEWAGVTNAFQFPGDPRQFSLRWADGSESEGAIWYDALEPGDAEVLAEYTEGPMKGLAAVTRSKIGKGSIVILGTTPAKGDLAKLLAMLVPEANVAPVADAPDHLLVVPRAGDAGEGLVAVEMMNRPATLPLDRPAVDLLTGAEYDGTVGIEPYGVAVLHYSR